MTQDAKRSRLEMARQTAAELLEQLETGSTPISESLMRAKRLARLLRDEDAQQWLDLETKGYPGDFDFGRLGSCQRYAVEGGRLTADSKYYPQSLPVIEAEFRAAEAALSSAGATTPHPPKVDNYIEAGATIKVLQTAQTYAASQRASYAIRSGLYASMRAALHSYATDASLALELGDAAEEIFEAARRDVDVFVRSHCPAAAQQLVAINERLRDADPESLSAALTSCRRLLATVADALFPPQKDDYTDRAGKKRKVGPEAYKNRIIAFVEQKVGNASTYLLLTSEIEHIAARLDALYEKACKGVHAQVSSAEARLTVISAFVFLGEVARLSALPQSSSPKAVLSDTTDEGKSAS